MNPDSFGIGVDIEEICRFEKYAKSKDEHFLRRILTESEIEYCFKNKTPASHIAARFCAKEAIYKAFCSVGISNLTFKDVEILNDKQGIPYANFLSDKTDGFICKLSLSHSRSTAVANVVVIKK